MFLECSNNKNKFCPQVKLLILDWSKKDFFIDKVLVKKFL